MERMKSIIKAKEIYEKIENKEVNQETPKKLKKICDLLLKSVSDQQFGFETKTEEKEIHYVDDYLWEVLHTDEKSKKTTKILKEIRANTEYFKGINID